jgi:hypothetical protein
MSVIIMLLNALTARDVVYEHTELELALLVLRGQMLRLERLYLVVADIVERHDLVLLLILLVYIGDVLLDDLNYFASNHF